MPENSEATKDLAARVVRSPLAWAALVGVVVLVVWVVYAARVAARLASEEEQKLHQAARIAVYLELAEALPGTHLTRVEQFQGGNLQVFLPAPELYAAADPRAVIRRAGETWCRQGHSWVLLPAVRFRDLQSGDTVATYSCTLARASLK